MVTALSHGAVSRSAEVAAPGLTVMAVILFMGKVSGAHLNPVVSLAFAMRRDFPWRRVPGYVVTQLLGATLACLFLLAVLGMAGGLGATQPGPGIHAWQALLIEVLLTLGLVSTILGTASGAQNIGSLSALAVGAYIVLAGLWASPISGASMNPARSFGPALVGLDFANFWIYLIGPGAGRCSLWAWPTSCVVPAAGIPPPSGGGGCALGRLRARLLRAMHLLRLLVRADRQLKRRCSDRRQRYRT